MTSRASFLDFLVAQNKIKWPWISTCTDMNVPLPDFIRVLININKGEKLSWKQRNVCNENRQQSTLGRLESRGNGKSKWRLMDRSKLFLVKSAYNFPPKSPQNIIEIRVGQKKKKVVQLTYYLILFYLRTSQYIELKYIVKRSRTSGNQTSIFGRPGRF